MKQIVILSGKGGTGKTSLTAAFADLAENKVLADVDVDASNLELVLDPAREEEHIFMGGKVAIIDREACVHCNLCEEACRFDAISHETGDYLVDEIACDGCKACVYVCPVEAIHMEEQHAGWQYRSESKYGTLLHAKLRPAQENSGRLVTLVKQKARLEALDNQNDYVIVDGPPGIGCPVISAASGADLAVIVVEPTVAGVHDLDRALDTVSHFNVPATVVINKADINPAKVAEIAAFCAENNLELIGEIPFDTLVTKAMVQGLPVTSFAPDSEVAKAMVETWRKVKALADSLGSVQKIS
jgi:MinD superfamily P-loop ATPase